MIKLKMIRIGTRGSKLALWQAENLQSKLSQLNVSSEIHIIKTKGDEIQDLSFDKIEGKGFFTKEIEESLAAEQVDVAVHSMKDLPTEMPKGLLIGGLSARADPADVLIINRSSYADGHILRLKPGAVVGTSSIRRKVQLRHLDPEIHTIDIRGNVPTRIKKMAEGYCDAIVLAAAGIERLEIDLSSYEVLKFHPTEFVSAPAQGVIAYQCRATDKATRKILQAIHVRETSLCTNVERKILSLMEGGCQLPLGAYCYRDKSGNYHCHAAYSKDINKPLIKVAISQSTHAGLAEAIVAQFKK